MNGDNQQAVADLQDYLRSELVLSPEERKLVLDHREAKRQRVEVIRVGINEAISVALRSYLTQNWENWPGTNRIANAVLTHLQNTGLLKL